MQLDGAAPAAIHAASVLSLCARSVAARVPFLFEAMGSDKATTEARSIAAITSGNRRAFVSGVRVRGPVLNGAVVYATSLS